MLTGLDDSPWHQLPTTFDHVGSSDPRFFDRLWFAASDGRGESALQCTLGVYQNMNVVDGGFVFIRDGRQHNVRLSRELRPLYDVSVKPLAIRVIDPMRHIHLSLDPSLAGVSAELDWTASHDAQEEKHHFVRVRGRIVEDYARYDQIGQLSGWVELDRTRHPIEHWWSCRDHSWGIRERVGIPEPRTGRDEAPAGSLFSFLFFSTETHAGHVQVARRGDKSSLTAELTQTDGTTSKATGVAMTAEFTDENRPRRFRSATFSVDLAGGDRVELEVTAQGPAVAMTGLGYGGYDDGFGLGVYRGNDHVETDVWDVSAPAVVGYPDGKKDRPIHRIQPVQVVQRGAGGTVSGSGSLTFIAEVEVDADGKLRLATED
jgi:hypothetical protein